MLNFGWMWRGSELPINELKDLLTEFEDSQYSFILFPTNSDKADFVPKASFLLDKTKKIKMMFAIRPYLLSPQYAAMLFAGFDQIDADRIMVNWVNGHNKGVGDQLISFPSNYMDFNVRHKYVEEYFEKLNKVSIVGQKSLPLQVIPINKEATIDLAKKHGMYPILHYKDFTEKHSKLRDFERVFVELSVMAIEDGLDKTAETGRIFSETDESYKLANSVVGYESDIIAEINRLNELGATDILISTLGDEDDKNTRELVHKIVRKILR